MQVLAHSFFLVLAAEFGDKTQLLALLLTARFRQPWTILAGIFVATLLNHALAGWAGAWVATLLPPHILRWFLAAVFFGFAVWILVPDKSDDLGTRGKYGAFLTTLISFFIAEMGDKTQLATVALGARFDDLFLVTLGTTLGMMAANAPAVAFGDVLMKRMPMTFVRRAAAVLFALFGLGIAFG